MLPKVVMISRPGQIYQKTISGDMSVIQLQVFEWFYGD